MAAEKLPDIASRLITSQFPGDDFSFLEPERLGTAHVEFHSLGSSATIAVGCRYDHLRSSCLDHEIFIRAAFLRPGDLHPCAEEQGIMRIWGVPIIKWCKPPARAARHFSQGLTPYGGQCPLRVFSQGCEGIGR